LLFSYDFYRIKKTPAVKVAFVLCAIIAVGLPFTLTPERVQQYFLSGIITPFTAMELISVYAIFGAVITGMYAAEDFNDGIISRVLATGANRLKFYMTKLLYVMLAFLFMVITMTVLLTITMIAVHGWNHPDYVNERYALSLLIFHVVYMVHYFAYAAIFTMIAFISKNAAITAGVGAGFYFLEVILYRVTLISSNSIITFISGNLPYSMFVRVGALGTTRPDLIFARQFITSVIPSGVIILLTTAIGVAVFKTTEP
jgi:ABC-type transport system involved in multi-copper enzyme maturation permease subunit